MRVNPDAPDEFEKRDLVRIHVEKRDLMRLEDGEQIQAIKTADHAGQVDVFAPGGRDFAVEFLETRKDFVEARHMFRVMPWFLTRGELGKSIVGAVIDFVDVIEASVQAT